MLRDHQKEFVEFIVRTGVLRFGEFKLKSGRISPYFFNLGIVSKGEDLITLGDFYAQTIKDNFPKFDILFGPSYKGISLSVCTAMALSKYGIDVCFASNRKEAKDHGEGGVFFGGKITETSKIVMIDDVITSGISITEQVVSLRESYPGIDILGATVAMDRMEVAKEGLGISGRELLLRDFNVKSYPVVNIEETIEVLKEKKLATDIDIKRMEEYILTHKA